MYLRPCFLLCARASAESAWWPRSHPWLACWCRE